MILFDISSCCGNINASTNHKCLFSCNSVLKCRISESIIVRLWFGKPLTKQRLDGVVNSWFSSRLITHNSWSHSVTHSSDATSRRAGPSLPQRTPVRIIMPMKNSYLFSNKIFTRSHFQKGNRLSIESTNRTIIYRQFHFHCTIKDYFNCNVQLETVAWFLILLQGRYIRVNFNDFISNANIRIHSFLFVPCT